ncbi:hypothetical protein EHEL_050135 [Encephalitozoon hellem ATCC 50504]|uniref:uncharacterized protein n=1 Tax=Encephalitozoon hellem (strain ATCC 50504) TaxID=907965 RepID=UPI00042E4B55|nr:uncharacterized protein EHEL_050135 [Encephalitozoon hellem ATCC 50504]AHL28926.1 hypothetical protein EHEL_050135 [Encephalitozoon hellem ATCC 50504]
MNIGLHKLCVMLISMMSALIQCENSHIHDLNGRVFRYGELRKWRYPRSFYTSRRHIPVYGGRGIITLEDLKKPNVPIVVPYQVTPKQVLTLLRH